MKGQPTSLCAADFFHMTTDNHIQATLRTTLENGVLRNEQLSGSAVNNFFDQGNFEAMKKLSGWEAARCDKHQFCAKIKVSTWAVLELIVV